MNTTNFASRIGMLFLSTVCAASAHAVTPDEVKSGQVESIYREIAMRCTNKTYASAWIESSRHFVRTSFSDPAEVERIASSPAVMENDIAFFSERDCVEFRHRLKELKASREQLDAAADGLVRRLGSSQAGK
ncbi:MAG: hypothetical protein ACXWC4_19295 [Telluria sp.]